MCVCVGGGGGGGFGGNFFHDSDKLPFIDFKTFSAVFFLQHVGLR